MNMNLCANNIFKATVLSASIAFASTASAAGTVHWDYSEPEKWHTLSPAFSSCEATPSSSQSPIDITNTTTIKKLRDLEADFDSYPLNVENNGHTIQVNYAPGSTTEINGEKYYLLQFHFHTTSEHAVDGQLSPMEIHFVHMNKKGELAVIGVLVKASHDGTSNDALATIISNAPEHAGEKHALHNDNGHVALDAESLLPNDDIENYYHYSGSLTTPPCSEGVKWYVSSKHIHASHEQIEAFEHIMNHGQPNNRPLQDLNAHRTIVEAKD